MANIPLLTSNNSGEVVAAINTLITEVNALTLSSTQVSQASRLVGPGRPISIVPIGDSITAGSSGGLPGTPMLASGYAETSIYSAGPRFRQLQNLGVGGQSTSQILPRILSQVIPINPDACMICAGTDDFTAGTPTAANYPPTMNNIKTMVQTLIAHRILPIIVAPPPNNNTPLWSRNLRWFLYRLCQYYGLPLLDMYAVVVDPSTGLYQGSYSGDGVHPNTAGIAAIGAVFGPLLKTIDTLVCGTYYGCFSATAAGEIQNLIKNSCMTAQSSPPTPDGWTLNQTNATVTNVSETLPWVGYNLNYVKTLAGAVYGARVPVVAGTYLTAGDTIRFSGGITVSGIAGVSGWIVDAGINGSAAVARPCSQWLQNGTFYFDYEFQIPAGTTSLGPNYYMAEAGTYVIHQPTMVNKTQADAIWQPGV